MTFEWNLNTGYANEAPWRRFEIPDKDLEDLDEEEIEDLVYACGWDDMENNVQLVIRQATTKKVV